MPSLSEKLKSLGVQIGAQNVSPSKSSNPYTIEKALNGHSLETRFGETFVIEENYPAEYRHGRGALFNNAPYRVLAQWARDKRIQSNSKDKFVYLDTETTGLSGGSGTYAFLIGVGRFEGDNFHLAQFFMRDPIEEPAQLYALEEFLAPCNAIVTYNGKSFDIPLLNSRFTFHGWRSPFDDLAHVDLLHLSRRLWRNRLSSRTLGNIEVQILGAHRNEQDVPGWMIPQMYFDYLRNGDARQLKKVIYHNSMDILSLSALFHHTADLLSEPTSSTVDNKIDLIAMARLFEDLGEIERALKLYLYIVDTQDSQYPGISDDLLIQAITSLALIFKRQGEFKLAIELWEKAAELRDINSHIELAKYYEHKSKKYDQAIEWTGNAINLINTDEYNLYKFRYWKPELEYRLSRLLRKQKRAN